MLVIDNLSCLGSRSAVPETVNHVVKTKLENNHKILAGGAVLQLFRPLEIVAERLLQHAVDKFCLLLLAQLQAVLADLLACSGKAAVGLFINTKIARLKA